MKSGWTVTKLVAAGGLAVLLTVLSLFGAGIQSVVGFVGAGGIVNALVTPGVTVLCLLVVDQFGAGAIMLLIQGILALPLPLTGTPGFLPKVPILFVAGILADVVYLLLKRWKRAAACAIGAVLYLYLGFAIVEIGRLFGIPGIEQTARLLYSPLLVGAMLLGAVGGFLGWLVYSRLENTGIVTRIQAR